VDALRSGKEGKRKGELGEDVTEYCTDAHRVFSIGEIKKS